MGPRSLPQQRTILKVYQHVLVDPFLLLCAAGRGPLPSSSPRGACEKGKLCHGPVGRKWRDSSHAVLVITLASVTHPTSDYKRRIHSFHSHLSPRLQCRHLAICRTITGLFPRSAAVCKRLASVLPAGSRSKVPCWPSPTRPYIGVGCRRRPVVMMSDVDAFRSCRSFRTEDGVRMV